MSPVKRWVLVVVSAVAVGMGGALLVLAKMSDPQPSSPSTDVAVVVSEAESTTSAPSAVLSPPAVEGVPPVPGPAAWAAFIAELNAIDPDIVGRKDEEALIDRGRNQCSSVHAYPNDQARLVALTNQRFTAPGHPQGFGEAKASRILAAVRKHICPTY